MDSGEQRRESFEDDGEGFRVDLDGYEGPLDLLLDLARRQKVDLARISVLALAEQYLVFVEAARRVRLELAADYLVMAAWLAYLKSRLLLPAPPKADEPDAAALAASLAHRLKRLQKIRAAAELLGERPHMGRDLFRRGAPEGVDVVNAPLYHGTLFDLLSAYARQRQKQALSHVSLRTRSVWSLAEAREALERILGMALEWTALDNFLLQWVASPGQTRTVRASTFSATLELVKEGRIDLRQDKTFGPLWLRRKEAQIRLRMTRRRRSPRSSVMSDQEHLFDLRAADAAALLAREAPTEAEREHMRLCEALIFAAAEPLSEDEMAKRLPEGADLAKALAYLKAQYYGRGVNLVRVGKKWMFRTAPDLAWALQREQIEPRKLSRAAMETLSIIAYHQPATRAEIEDIRGVALSKGTMDVLLETGWVRLRGRRRAPGRPVTFGTTEKFLLHFGLEQISDLPGLDDLKAAGLFDGRLPKGFGVPQPRDNSALADDEEPLGDEPLGEAFASDLPESEGQA